MGEANGRISILSFDKQPGEQKATLEEDAEEDEGDEGMFADYILPLGLVTNLTFFRLHCERVRPSLHSQSSE